MARLNPVLFSLSLALATATALAQDGDSAGAAAGTTADVAGKLMDDLTQPPRIDPAAEPGAADIEPAPEERDDMLEAVVTRGQTDWRLPDLGTSLRRDEDELEPGQRIAVNWLPLYDPENQDPVENLFKDYEDTRNVGFLRIFDIRFGERSVPNEPDE